MGSWIYTISWDNSFTADVLAMLQPESLKETIKLNFREGQMKQTYISWRGAGGNIIYLQEPFAIQTMIEAYIRHTGDEGILREKAGKYTIYEGMKRWCRVLHDDYGREDGLIDIGYSTEKIIEIRTDGYNHVVPVVNGLTIKLYRQVARWGESLRDQEAPKFSRWADRTAESFHSKL